MCHVAATKKQNAHRHAEAASFRQTICTFAKPMEWALHFTKTGKANDKCTLHSLNIVAHALCSCCMRCAASAPRESGTLSMGEISAPGCRSLSCARCNSLTLACRCMCRPASILHTCLGVKSAFFIHVQHICSNACASSHPITSGQSRVCVRFAKRRTNCRTSCLGEQGALYSVACPPLR